MRFGHYTVFDTPEENKHTQVYVEYDVPNNDDLEGATGTIVLTEGGQGSGGGDAGNGIRSITISPAITTTPALASLLPIYYEDLTEEQKQSGIGYHGDAVGIGDGNEFTITVTPTSDWYAWQLVNGAPVFGGKGDPITFTKESSGNVLEFQCGAANQTEMAEGMAVVNFTASIGEE